MTDNNLRILLSILILVISLFLFQRCAQPSSPTGGDEDKDPPVLLFSYPQQKEKMYKDDKLILVFNEWVKLNSINKELVITPSVEENYKSKYKKNEIYISNIKLDTNTTYIFNFRKSIVDITEKNPAEDLNLIFSTGDKIDSLEISGYINNSPLKNTKLVVGLYEDIDSLNLFTAKAKYLVNADSTNHFRFRYLKPDTYKIYAFTDDNGNNKCESKKEPYAFLKEKLIINKSLDSLELTLAENNLDSLKILGSKKNGKYFEISFSKPIDTVNVKSNQNDSLLFQMIDKKNKLRLYNVHEDTLQRELILQVFDKVNNKIDTTINYKFKKKSKITDEYKMTVEQKEIIEDQLMKIKFTFTKPSIINVQDSLGFYIDSTKLTVNPLLTWNYNHTHLELEQKLEIDSLFEHFKEKNSIELDKKEEIKFPRIQYYIPKGSFLSIDQDSSLFKSAVLKIIKPEDRSSISGTIACDASHLVFELMKDSKVVRRIKHQSEFSFKYLQPGKYTFRYFTDSNLNGKIDNGNFFENILPEQYTNLDKEYELRASWSMEKQEIKCENSTEDIEEDVDK